MRSRTSSPLISSPKAVYWRSRNFASPWQRKNWLPAESGCAERAIEITRTPERICVGLLGKDPLAGCQESDGGPFVSMVYIDPYLYRCTHFTVAPGGEAEAVLGDPGDELMLVLVRRGDHRGRQLRYELQSGSRPKGSRALVVRAELRARPSPAGERARVHLVNSGDEPERICLAAARFGS